MTEGPVLIHVWAVDPTEESSNVQRLDELFAHQIATDPGFVSARILVSDDRTSIAAVIEMRSVEDRQRIEQLPEVRETLDHLHGAANLVLRLYEQVKAYHA
jgi:hypothetical protein